MLLSVIYFNSQSKFFYPKSGTGFIYFHCIHMIQNRSPDPNCQLFASEDIVMTAAVDLKHPS